MKINILNTFGIQTLKRFNFILRDKEETIEKKKKIGEGFNGKVWKLNEEEVFKELHTPIDISEYERTVRELLIHR